MKRQKQEKRMLQQFFSLSPGYRRPKNVIVEAVVIFELAFRDVERKVLAADLVIAADDAALELRPEALNRVRVDRADNVTLGGMIDGFMRVVGGQSAIDAAFVGRQQAYFIRDDFADKRFAFVLADCAKDAGDDVTLALHSANNGHLGGRGMEAADEIERLQAALAGVLKDFVNPHDGGEFERGEIPSLDVARDLLGHQQSQPK